MSTFITLIKKAMIFSLGPLLAAVASLLALPALTQNFGAEGWAAIAIGLSVGTAASVFVELGWGLDGLPRVSRAGQSARKTIFALSTATKLVTLPISAIIAGIVSACISINFKPEAAATAVYATTLGLSAAWYFIGTGKPGALVLTDSVPKVTFTVAAAFALYMGMPLMVYPVLLLLGSGLSFVLSVGIILRNRMSVFRAFSIWRISRALVGQITALRGRASNALYIALPTAILGIVSPSSVVTFASTDRLQNMALTVLQVARNTLVGWATSEYDLSARWARTKVAIIANSGFGLAASIVWVYMIDTLAQWVFSGTVTIPMEIVWLSAYFIWVTSTSRAVGLIGLVGFGGIKHVSNSAGIGAIVGTVLLVLLGAQLGAIGAILALAITETVVLIWQLIALRYLLRVAN